MATVSKRTWKTSKGESRQAWVLAFNDKSGVRHKEQFATKREADARRLEVEVQVKGGTYRADATTKTVKDACEGYLADLDKRRSRNERVTEHYYRTTEGQLYNYVAPQDDRPVDFDKGIGEVKLSQLSSRVVTQFRDDLRDAGVGVITTRRILGSLSRAIKWARSQDWIATNPAEKITVTGRRDEGAKKVVPPSKAALAKIIKEAESSLAIKIKFAAASGLRASELWALPWANLDLKKGEVRVDRRLDAYGSIDITKSDAGVRTVPLGAQIIAVMKEWKLAATRKGDDDLVFPNSKGGFIYHRNFMKREWRPLLEKVKDSDPGFRADGWHALRHFAISTWIEADMKPKTIQTFAGHSTLALTMTRYGHLFASDDHRQAMDKIASDIFG